MSQTKVGGYRWTIVTLLLFSTTINYMDRNVIGYLKPLLTEDFGWTNSDFAFIVTCFTICYAGVTIIAGWIIDKIGTKLGLALSLIIWSIFGMLNAICGRAVWGHAIVRSLFGIGEAGNFPASIKTVAEWFPKKERALATGIFNSGANIGAMIAALTVPWIATSVWFGGAIASWKMAYILTGAIGFLWLIFWFAIYTPPGKQKKLSQAEYDYIHADEIIENKPVVDGDTAKKVSWGKLFSFKQTWAFFVGKFLTDGIWWFLLFWLPDYLQKQFGMTTQEVKWPTFIVYGVAIFGSVFGGSIPIFFMNKGMEAYKARMTAMFLIAIFPLSVLTTQYFGNVAHFGGNAATYAIIVICIAAAAHQAWSANLFTTVSDMFPKKAIGSVVGIGGMAGGIGGAMVQLLAGRITDKFQFIGIAKSWTLAQASGLAPYTDKIRSMNLTNKHHEFIDVNKVAVINMSKDVLAQLQKVDSVSFQAFRKIQVATVQPEMAHAYGIMFAVCATSYIVAWIFMKLLVPKYSPITDL